MNRNLNLNSNNENLANSNANGRIAQKCMLGIFMKTYRNLYNYLCSMGNLMIAWRKARKGKSGSFDIIDFEADLIRNLLSLHYELKNKTYKPKPLRTFVLRDPKTRVISKSDFRDRIVHHALINCIKHIFENTFIYDSCANQLNKGTLFALKRFQKFMRKVSDPISQRGFCLKADIRHYFQEVDHEILLNIIRKRLDDCDVIWLIQQILSNNLNESISGERIIGMPLGNYTSQFFANVYLNELDYFVKHQLKVKYYVRYVDDFVILHKSSRQLSIWKDEIDRFLREKLRIKLHSDKSRIIPISRGIDFVGFRNFYYYRILRRRNILSMRRKISFYEKGIVSFQKIYEVFKGWRAYAMWGDTYRLQNVLKGEIIEILWRKI